MEDGNLECTKSGQGWSPHIEIHVFNPFMLFGGGHL